MLIALIIIFIALTLIVGGNRSAKSLITLSINSLFLLGIIFAVYKGANPLYVSLLACISVSCISIFYQNGFNHKTQSAFLCVFIIIVLMLPIVYFFGGMSAIQGFPSEQFEITDTNGYSRNIGINMGLLQISVIMMLVTGAIIDTAMAISSALFQIHENNKHLSHVHLFKSGINIGKDILATTIQTIFFIFIAEYINLILQFLDGYSISAIVNSKAFAQETISMLATCISCVAIIPLTAFLSTFMYKKRHA